MYLGLLLVNLGPSTLVALASFHREQQTRILRNCYSIRSPALLGAPANPQTRQTAKSRTRARSRGEGMLAGRGMGRVWRDSMERCCDEGTGAFNNCSICCVLNIEEVAISRDFTTTWYLCVCQRRPTSVSHQFL